MGCGKLIQILLLKIVFYVSAMYIMFSLLETRVCALCFPPYCLKVFSSSLKLKSEKLWEEIDGKVLISEYSETYEGQIK